MPRHNDHPGPRRDPAATAGELEGSLPRCRRRSGARMNDADHEAVPADPRREVPGRERGGGQSGGGGAAVGQCRDAEGRAMAW